MMLLLFLSFATWFIPVQATPATPDEIQNTPVPASRQADIVAVIEVHSPIDAITAHSIKRRVKKAVALGAEAIVFDLHTPGGDVESMLEICRFIKQDTPVKTAAWINPEAYSAGAIIALAADEIVMVPSARMGDAAPIAGVPGAGMLNLPAAERAKIEAPLLAEVVDSARINGYDEKLLQSFVGVRFALWEIEERDGPGRLFIDANEYAEIFGEAPPLERVRGSTPATPSTSPPLSPETSEIVEVIQEVVTARELPGPDDAAAWQLRGQIVGEEELLIVDAETARRVGIASAIVPDDAALKRHFAAINVVRHGEQWSELLVRFLTSWPVRIILIAIIVIGFFLEIAAPGASIFGGAALVALAIMLGAPILVGMASWWEVLLVLLGLVLIGMEILVVPGIGVLGILGAISLLVGLVGIFVTADYGTPEASNQITTAVAAILGATLFGGVAAWWIARQTGGFWLFKRMVLDAQSGTSMNPRAGAPTHPRGALVGRTGRATTDLRPSGRIEVDTTLYTARSTVGWINEGSPVKVLREFAGELEVEPLEQGTDQESEPAMDEDDRTKDE